MESDTSVPMMESDTTRVIVIESGNSMTLMEIDTSANCDDRE